MYKRGWKLHVVELAGHVLPRMLDADSARLVEAWLQKKGVALHTVGQRRGLGIATGQPMFVTGLVPETNTVVVGKPEELLKSSCTLQEVNWIEGPAPVEPRRVMGKARYRSTEVPCTVRGDGNGGLLVDFDEPQRAITPGQALVLYEGEYVLGGGTIDR